MICCVIGGAVVALVSTRLARLPIIGRVLARRRQNAFDPSGWRLDTSAAPEMNS